jgi:hypothetical protein
MISNPREFHLMMKPKMIPTIADQKVGVSVIGFVHVDMMNTFAFLQPSPQNLFSLFDMDKRSVLSYVIPNSDITSLLKVFLSTCPCQSLFATLRKYSGAVSPGAFPRAKLKLNGRLGVTLFTAFLANTLHSNNLGFRRAWSAPFGYIRDRNATVRARLALTVSRLSRLASRAKSEIIRIRFFLETDSAKHRDKLPIEQSDKRDANSLAVQDGHALGRGVGGTHVHHDVATNRTKNIFDAHTDHAAHFAGFLPRIHDIVGENVTKFGNYQPDDFSEKNEHRGIRELYNDAQKQFYRIAFVGNFCDRSQVSSKFNVTDIRKGSGIKHGGLLLGECPPCYNSHSLSRGSITAVVRAGCVFPHTSGSISWGLLGLLYNFLLDRLYFILRFGRILEIKLKRSKDFTIERASVIVGTLLDRFVQFLIGETKVCCNHSNILASRQHLIKPQFPMKGTI